MSLTAVLLVLFIVLKLVGVIAWSWLWVLAPLWIPALFALVLAVFGVSFVGAATRRVRKR